MADKYVSVSALRELLGIPSDGQCTGCQFVTIHGCKDDSLQRACEAIDDAPEAVVVEKAEWDKLMFLVEAANNALKSAQKWIPVKERLPEDRHSVLVYCPHNKCIYTAYYDDFNDEWYYFGCGGGIEVYYTVTHWMPLPEPPKEEAAISEIMSEPTDAHYPSWYAERIAKIPAADVVEVRRGRWEYEQFTVMYGNPYGCYRCSACGDASPHISNYCPNCGADMREVKSDG